MLTPSKAKNAEVYVLKLAVEFQLYEVVPDSLDESVIVGIVLYQPLIPSGVEGLREIVVVGGVVSGSVCVVKDQLYGFKVLVALSTIPEDRDAVYVVL